MKETMKSGVKILETTLRDGNYAIDFQFTAKDTAMIAAALESAGFEIIEVGHGLGLNAACCGKGESAATDEEYLEAAASTLTRAKWGMFFIPGIGRHEDLELAARYGMHFVRVGTNVTEVEQSEPYVKHAKELGFFVSSNLMKSYALSPLEVARQAKLAQDYGTDIVVLVDSAGGMLPSDIEEYMRAIREYTDVLIGFHCHDNLRLGMANALKAIECGAAIIDSSLQGMGRSAGNPPTEVLAVLLKKLGFETGIDINKTMDIGEKIIKPLFRKQGVDAIDITSGYARFHSSYLKSILRFADEYEVDPRDLIIGVCEKNVVYAPEDLVREVAERLQQQEEGSSGLRQTELKQFVFRRQDRVMGGLKDEARRLAQEMKTLSLKLGKKSIFNIVVPIKPERKTVLSRFIQEGFDFVIGSAEVDNREQFIELVEAVDGLVDYILVDAEQKLPGEDNFVELAQRSVSRSQVISYKDNDTWAKAIENLIAQLLEEVRGSRITIYGLDNPSLKLALALAERGARVTLSWLNEAALQTRVEALNLIRIETAEPLQSESDLVQAAQAADVLVGFTPQMVIVEEEMLRVMNPKGFVADAGIGSVSAPAIEYGNQVGIRIIRSDMRAALAGEISSVLGTKHIVARVMGRAQVNGVSIVAGGLLANKGDVVVDSIHNPTKVIGIADGQGHVIYEDREEYRAIIERVETGIMRRAILLEE